MNTWPSAPAATTVWPLTAGGTLVAWGENTNGQCNVPAGPRLRRHRGRVFTTIWRCGPTARSSPGATTRADSAGSRRGRSSWPSPPETWHSLGIRSDGSLVAWGWNDDRQCDVPPGHDYIDISGGYYHSLALKADRSIVAWGGNGDGQCNVPAGHEFLRIAAGLMHSVALRADGTIVAWGRNEEGQCRVPAGSDFVAIAAGSFHSLALQAGGHVEAWGQNEFNQCNTPAADNVAAIAAGKFHSLAIRDNRPHLPAALPNLTKAPAAKPAIDRNEKGVTTTRTSPSNAEKKQIQPLGTAKRPATASSNGSANPNLAGAAPKPEQTQAPPPHARGSPRGQPAEEQGGRHQTDGFSKTGADPGSPDRAPRQSPRLTSRRAKRPPSNRRLLQNRSRPRQPSHAPRQSLRPTSRRAKRPPSNRRLLQNRSRPRQPRRALRQSPRLTSRRAKRPAPHRRLLRNPTRRRRPSLRRPRRRNRARWTPRRQTRIAPATPAAKPAMKASGDSAGAAKTAAKQSGPSTQGPATGGKTFE